MLIGIQLSVCGADLYSKYTGSQMFAMNYRLIYIGVVIMYCAMCTI